jgi:two-component system sensor histidine kinase KdpD
MDGATLVDAAPVYADQILRNLLSNAEKYSPPDAPINVSVVADDEETLVCVSDHGAGVPSDEMGHLFTPFYRSASTEHAAPGAGIGLAVCKRLVEAQGGRICAEPREGGGMTFCFSLRAIEESAGDSTA